MNNNHMNKNIIIILFDPIYCQVTGTGNGTGDGTGDDKTF